jgi:hypothetical protein
MILIVSLPTPRFFFHLFSTKKNLENIFQFVLVYILLKFTLKRNFETYFPKLDWILSSLQKPISNMRVPWLT